MAYTKLALTYPNVIYGDTYFRLPNPVGETPYWEADDAGTYECRTPDGLSVKLCPSHGAAPIVAQVDAADLVMVSPTPGWSGMTFAAPPVPRRGGTLPFEYVRVTVRINLDLGVSRMATNNTPDPCEYQANTFPPHVPPIVTFCGPNYWDPVVWTADIGIPTAPLDLLPEGVGPENPEGGGTSVYGDVYSELKHASEDPADWDYQEEPGNPDARYLFAVDRFEHLHLLGDGYSFNKLAAEIATFVRPYSSVAPFEPDESEIVVGAISGGIVPLEGW